MNWHFYSAALSDARARWIWVCEDADHRVVQQSGRTFESYSACLADALKRGYRGIEHTELALHA